MLINIENMTDLTGSTRKTILRRVKDLIPQITKGRGHWYESKEALPLVFGLGNESKKGSLEVERTRLTSVQAEKIELEIKVIKGQLIPAEHVREVVDTMLSAFRSKMLSLPTKAAHAVLPLADQAEAEDVLREYVNEALQELSDYDSKTYCTSNNKQSGEAHGTASITDSKSVGGHKKKAVKRSIKRTRPVEH